MSEHAKRAAEAVAAEMSAVREFPKAVGDDSSTRATTPSTPPPHRIDLRPVPIEPISAPEMAVSFRKPDEPTRDRRHWLAPAAIGGDAPPLPPAQFGELARFRDVEPLDAARHYGREALLLADRARWESGVATQAALRGNHQFAAEVSVTATRHAAAARFLATLLTSAIEHWLLHNPDRTVSLGISQLTDRVQREVDNAVAVSTEAAVRIDTVADNFTPDPRD